MIFILSGARFLDHFGDSKIHYLHIDADGSLKDEFFVEKHDYDATIRPWWNTFGWTIPYKIISTFQI